MKNFKTHRFFCLNCAKEGIPLPRKQGHRHAKFHKKKMYCPNCKQVFNHIECQTEEDIYRFKEDFENGVYLNEIKIS